MAFALALLMGGCASSGPSFSEDPADYEDEVAELQARLSDNPSDGEALRDLGQIYMQTGRPNRAYDTLKSAYARLPNDPKTLFYLGMATESVGRTGAALELFAQYDRVPSDSRYRELMEGRYEWLVRQQARAEIRSMMVREAELSEQNISRSILAVLPLNYRGVNARYEPLGRGLAEMLITDLANVGDLRVVERVRLQAILNEVEFGQTDYVDPSTAPRVGRLLGAGRLAGGSYRVSESENIRMDMTVVELDADTTPSVPTQTGDLTDLFALQKDLVLALLDALNVTLTSEERAAISAPPTESLESFLAFSRGLLDEDSGNFEAAAKHYREAADIDPGFDAATQRASKAERLRTAGGTTKNALSAALGPQVSSALLQQRLNNMGRRHLGINDLIDDDRRTPVEDIGGIIDDELPPPPNPPQPPE
jgi:tetratricopeptide (TPR) repeat protein